MQGRLLVLVALLATSCRRELNLPDAGGSKTVIFVVDDGTTLSAFAAPTATSFSLPFELDAKGTSYVGLYTQSLDEMDLLTGPLELAQPGATLSRQVPAATHWFQRTQHNSTQDWTAADPEPPFGPLWVVGERRRPKPCPTLSVRAVAMPKQAWVTMGLHTNTSSVFFATDEGCFFRLSPSDTEPALVTALSGKRPHGAGFGNPDESLWLSECPMTLDQVHLASDPPDPDDQPRCLGGRVPPGTGPEAGCMIGEWIGGSWVIMLDGPPGGPPEFVMNRRGTIWRLAQNGGWNQVHETDPGPLGVHYTFITWTGPSEAILTHTHDTMVLFDAMGERDVSIVPGLSLMRAVQSPSGILLSGWKGDDNRATIFSYDRQRQAAHAFVSNQLPARVSALIPVGQESFFFAGDLGTAGWFEPDTGLCAIALGGDTDRRLGTMDFYYGAAANDHQALLFGYTDPGSSSSLVWWLERQ